MITRVDNLHAAGKIVVETDDSEKITIEKADGKVYITISDFSDDGYEHNMVLGEDSETTIL
jgi:hypothetical protein